MHTLDAQQKEVGGGEGAEMKHRQRTLQGAMVEKVLGALAA